MAKISNIKKIHFHISELGYLLTYCVHRKEKSYSPNEIPPHTITYIQKNQYCGVAKYYMYATIGV